MPDPGLPAQGCAPHIGWWSTRRVGALGHVFRLTSDHSGLVEYLEEIFAGLPSGDAGRAQHLYTLTCGAESALCRLDLDGRVLGSSDRLGYCLDLFHWQLTQAAALSVDRGVALHAGGVLGPAGVVLIPGPAGAGKTTLVLALVHAGLGYLSDEVVVLQAETMRASGLARPLAVKGDGGPVRAILADMAEPPTRFRTEIRRLPAQALGCGGKCEEGPVAAIVVPALDPGGPTRLTPLGVAETVSLLAQHRYRQNGCAGADLAVLARVAGQAPGYRLCYSDFADAVQVVKAAAGCGM